MHTKKLNNLNTKTTVQYDICKKTFSPIQIPVKGLFGQKLDFLIIKKKKKKKNAENGNNF